MNTVANLVNMIHQSGVYKINTVLFAVSFPQLRVLQELALETDNYDFSLAEYRVLTIILVIANYRLFKPVRSHVPVDLPKNFMKIKFMNKAIHAINLLAILLSKSVAKRISVYFRYKESLVKSYEYTNTIASKLFNFPSTLSNLDITSYFLSPHSYPCETSKFCYKSHGHVNNW